MAEKQGAQMDAALGRFTDIEDADQVMNDDIDTLDEEYSDRLKFESNQNGDYAPLVPHLGEFISAGEKRKGFNLRGELFHETVMETISDSWIACPQMCTKLLRGYPYVGILFDTNDIGGFTSKDKRNEQKGSIIECINCGHIKTLILPGLLNRGYFVFLPDIKTLLTMMDFPLLKEAGYRICFVSQGGDVRCTDIDVSHKSMSNVMLKHLYIQDMLVTALEGFDIASVEEFDPSEYKAAAAEKAVQEAVGGAPGEDDGIDDNIEPEDLDETDFSASDDLIDDEEDYEEDSFEEPPDDIGLPPDDLYEEDLPFIEED